MFLAISLVPHMVFYTQTPDQGDSTMFKALAVFFVVLTANVVAVTLLLTPRRLDRWRSIPPKLYQAGVVLSLAALLLFGIGMRAEWLYAHMGLVLSGTVIVTLWTFYSDRNVPVAWRPALALVLVGAAAIIAIRLYSLSAYPPIHFIDEPWTLGWAISYVRTGQLSDWIMIDRDFDIYKYYAAMGQWLDILGVGFWRARLFSALVLSATFAFAVLAAWRLYERRTAFYTGAALFSSAIFLSGARIRHDAGLGLSIALSLWLYAEARQRDNRWQHLLAGVVLGLGMFAHYHAAIFLAPMIFGLYGPRYLAALKSRHYWPESGAWLYGIGGIIGLSAVTLVQSLPSSTNDHLGESVARTLNPGNFSSAYIQHITNITHFSHFEFAIIVVGIAAALWRSDARDWTLLLLAAGLHAGLAIASSGANFEYYLVPLTPVYGLLVGSMIARGINSKHAPLPLRASSQGAALRSLVLVIALGYTLRAPLEHVLQRRPVELAPSEAAAWVREHEETSQMIVGDHRHFIWLTDYRFISPLAPNLLPSELQEQLGNPEAMWDMVQPDVFIVDTASSSYPLLRPLVEAGYFERESYRKAATFGTTTIYEYAGSD